MSRRRKSSASSVLSKQKPQRKSRKAQERKRRIARFLLISAVVLLGAGAGYWGVISAWDQWLAWWEKPAPWQVTLQLEGDQPLSEREANKVIAQAKRGLRHGSPERLQATARAIQQAAGFEQVQIIRTSLNQALVTIKRRWPIGCAKINRTYLLSTLGAIYGKPVEDESLCQGPVYDGFVGRSEGRGPYRWQDDGQLSLRESERSRLKTAISLNESLRELGYEAKQFDYLSHRGLGVQLGKPDTYILLGLPPFTQRLERMQEILKSLESKGDIAQRIELDYQGKAFIRLHEQL